MDPYQGRRGGRAPGQLPHGVGSLGWRNQLSI